MKKTITILLVLLVAAFAVFATITNPNQTVVLKKTIAEKVDLSYNLGYSTDGTSWTDMTAAEETDNVAIDPEAETIVNFRVIQAPLVNLKNGTSLSVDLKVDVTDLILNEDSVQMASPNANQYNAITLSTPATSLDNNELTENVDFSVISAVATSGHNHTVTLNLAYSQGLTEALTELFTFDVSWGARAASTLLEAGDYTSKVTLNYIAE